MATDYGRMIINELNLDKKTVDNDEQMGGFAGGEKYKVNKILFVSVCLLCDLLVMSSFSLSNADVKRFVVFPFPLPTYFV